MKNVRNQSAVIKFHHFFPFRIDKQPNRQTPYFDQSLLYIFIGKRERERTIPDYFKFITKKSKKIIPFLISVLISVNNDFDREEEFKQNEANEAILILRIDLFLLDLIEQ